MGKDFFSSHDAGPEWGTPAWIWKPLAEALDGFDLDPASGAEETPIAETCLTLDSSLPEPDNPYENADGLEAPWYGDVWVNPPYGRGFNNPWARRIASQAQNENVETVTALIPAATSTKRWHENDPPLSSADLFTFINGRVEFHGAGSDGGSFASVLLTWGDVPPAYLEALEEIGFTLKHQG